MEQTSQYVKHQCRWTLYQRLEVTDLAGRTKGLIPMIGYLRLQGIHVPRRRRESLHQVDPVGIEERCFTTVQWRTWVPEAFERVWLLSSIKRMHGSWWNPIGGGWSASVMTANILPRVTSVTSVTLFCPIGLNWKGIVIEIASIAMYLHAHCM